MNVVEELTEDRVDRDHVERRLADWRHRLAELYADTAAWMPEGWSATEEGHVTMREELVSRFLLPEQKLPVLALAWQGKPRGRLEPRELWIIGSNGRVDLILPDRHFLIQDRSESFEAPDWQISNLLDRMHDVPFRRETLNDALT